MSRICPHCNYARQSADSAPDWQCPACEKAYVKAGGPLPPPSLCQYATPVERRTGGGKWLLVALAFGAAFWFGRPLLQSQSGPSAAAVASGQPEVILYSTEWCGYCKMTREFFAANGIRYTERDIEKSSVALGQHRKLGGRGVPLIVVDDAVIKGYDEPALRQSLAPWIRG